MFRITTCAIVAVIAMVGFSLAQDRREIVPEMKVLFENECVRAQYHDVPVGKTIPMHSHPNYVVYTLKPFEARIRLPDGTERISKREAGVAYWNEPITHSVENLGDSDIHNLIIELRPGASCQAQATSEAEKASPVHPQVHTPGPPAPSGPSDEETVRKLDDEERIAALKLDYAALERLWSEHFIANMPSNQILPNRTAVLEWFRKGMTTRSSYERTIEQIRVDGDIAVVMGAETLTPTANAPLAGQTVRRRFTNIWKKEDGTWRLWARHANVISQNMSSNPPVVPIAPIAASAGAEDKCTLGTLKGQYAFTGRGFIEALEPGVQRMHYGFFRFDGSGKLTGKQSSSRGGKIGREKLEGTYTLDPDCSGTMTFSFAGNPRSETHWDIYVTDGGKKGNMIRMDEGNMAVRSFAK